MTEERVAFLDHCPGQIQPGPFKRGQFGKDRIRAGHFRQRRIERFLVATEMVFAAETARGDLNQVASLDRSATPAVAGSQGDLHRRNLHFRDFLDEGACHRAGKIHQRLALVRRRHHIDYEHGFAAAGLIAQVTQRAVRPHDSDDVQAVQLHAVPRPFADRPDQHAFLAGEAHLRVGETGAGVNVARTHFQIIAGDRRRELLPGERGGRRQHDTCNA